MAVTNIVGVPSPEPEKRDTSRKLYVCIEEVIQEYPGHLASNHSLVPTVGPRRYSDCVNRVFNVYTMVEEDSDQSEVLSRKGKCSGNILSPTLQ
jgi:hypothetical protein